MERDSQNVLLASIRRLTRAERGPQLRRVITRTHPAELAHLFGNLTIGQRLMVFETLDDDEKRAEMVAELDSSLLEEFLAELSDDVISRLLMVMPSDDSTYLLQSVPEERKDLLLDAMPADDHAEASSMMGYDPESAGALMVTDFLAFKEDVTAGEAVQILQKGAEDAEIVFYIYVVNDHEHLVGVTSLRELVQQPTGRALRDFMIRDVLRVGVDTDQEDVARMVARYNLLALPVVGESNHLVGIVTVDDIIDVIRLEANEDVLRMAGALEQDISLHRSPFASARSRLPWLMPSFVAGAAGVFIISRFDQTLMEASLLVAFVPMVLGLSRNIGVQSATLTSRGIAMDSIGFGKWRKVIGRETLIALICGLLYGLVASLLGGFYLAAVGGVSKASAPTFGLVTGLSVFFTMVLASAFGAFFPLLMVRWKLDPALATGPFFTTTVDVFSVAFYLTLATYWFG